MVKSKKASVKLAKKQPKSEIKQVKNNPFEIHTNRRKHDILGRNLKHDKGLPGISRSKAIKKRQKTLLVEYKQKNKANMFIDRRFGEYDEKMTLEEKMMKRFTMEKKHHHERRGKYRLEDEELTHLGQSLGEIDKFDDVLLSDDDDNVDHNQDDVDDVKELHFGGFLTKKKTADNLSDKDEDKHKSRKEIMEEVVAKAKIKKHERQMAKEETVNLTDKLDQDWKSLRNLMSNKGLHSAEIPATKSDDYDIAVRQLAFEIKGKATDRLKSEQELAKEEQERLRKLELERQRRMKGLPAVDKKPKHVSADDLGDSFTPAEDDRVLLSYQDGSMLNVEDDEDQLSGDNGSDLEQNEENVAVDQKEEEGESSAEDDAEDDDSEETSEDDNGSDLESDDSNDDIEANLDSNVELEDKNLQKSVKSNEDVLKEDTRAGKELPFTFKAPKSFSEFKELINGWSYQDQLTIVDRIKACHNPKITPENKPKMEALFNILLEYVNDLSLMGSEELEMIDKLSRHLFDVAQYSPLHSARQMQQIIKDIHKSFTENRDRLGGKGMFLGLSELMILRIVSILFSASDFKHAVCTPAMVLMSQVLAQSPVRCMRDVFRGLFICDLCLEYISLSKRLIPEAVNFLCGILFLGSSKEGRTPQLVLPFKESTKWRDLLKLQSDASSLVVKPVPITKTLGEVSEAELTTDEVRISALNHCLFALNKFVDMYQDVPASLEIFAPVKEHLQRIPVDLYPTPFKELYSTLLSRLNDIYIASLSRKHLTLQARKPEAIKTFEPKFEEHYEVRSRRGAGNKASNEKQKLRYKYKKEFKGAIREIRKDNKFLAKQKLQEQLEKDAERMRKVKEIEHMLSNQQAETNAMNRKKRKLGK
ncbi:nucleolar complex protein 14 [Porites harrisoni]